MSFARVTFTTKAKTPTRPQRNAFPDESHWPRPVTDCFLPREWRRREEEEGKIWVDDYAARVADDLAPSMSGKTAHAEYKWCTWCFMQSAARTHPCRTSNGNPSSSGKRSPKVVDTPNEPYHPMFSPMTEPSLHLFPFPLHPIWTFAFPLVCSNFVFFRRPGGFVLIARIVAPYS